MRRLTLISLLWLSVMGDAALADPTASLTISEPRLSGVPITFDASGSTVSDGMITSYGWDLDGDGQFTYTSDAIVERSFAPGSYVVRLEVTASDPTGEESTDLVERTVTVTNSRPSASFGFAPRSPLTAEPVTFASTSSDPDGIPSGGQRWDLDGDGRFDDGSGVRATRRFRHPGSYVVRLLVEDRYGGVAVVDGFVTVRNRPPAAGFAMFPRSPEIDEAVELASTSSDVDGAIAQIRWDLDGDGAFDDAKGATASTVFRTAGRHRVGVAVVDTDGGSATASRTVRTRAPAKPRSPRFLSPWPTVRIAGRALPGGARITRLAVTVPAASSIDARCSGLHCPVRHVRRRARGERETVVVRLRRFERLLPAGTRIAIRIRAANRIGRYVAFRIRGDRPPRRTDRCLLPGRFAPIRCRGL
jgi:PKD repeat protein